MRTLTLDEAVAMGSPLLTNDEIRALYEIGGMVRAEDGTWSATYGPP